jgi:hypothetical protein
MGGTPNGSWPGFQAIQRNRSRSRSRSPAVEGGTGPPASAVGRAIGSPDPVRAVLPKRHTQREICKLDAQIQEIPHSTLSCDVN